MSTDAAVESTNGQTEPFQAPVEIPPVETAHEVQPLAADALLLAEIREMERECGELEGIAEHDANRAKASKKRLEAAVDELRSKIRSRQEEYPLFDKPAETGVVEQSDEGWREVAIDILSAHGLSDSIVAKLEEDNEIETIGRLADWTAAGKHLTDLTGIGAAKAEAIEKALEGFWASWGTNAVNERIEEVEAEAND